ncbi:hypothetical protein AX17_006900 [Amanita inopinata Kibby_2008]|nr:hypothetical protein AX17_006900 [Amanita inopinata Kibby_2008]
MTSFGPVHFLSLPRPDVTFGPAPGVPDTTTLAAHDFDVDNRTGFMPPQPPASRLPKTWEAWETVLDDAIADRLKLGDTPGLSISESHKSAMWRHRVRNMPVLLIGELRKSEIMLRRAHLVLAWILHFYVHTLPLDVPITIPAPLTIPLLRVSAQLQLPPVLTYSDDVLYNWYLKTPSTSPLPAIDNIGCQTLFTGTEDEEEFYLLSARIELKGVDALELMRVIMDEAFVGDELAIQRITKFLNKLAVVIQGLRALLTTIRDRCDPEVFYRQVRPWMRGMDSGPAKRKWFFEGLDQDPELCEPTELSGPSAGQSSLIHALDIFLGVDRYSHSQTLTGAGVPGIVSNDATATSLPSETSVVKQSFLTRMQQYMPRHHRNFLHHLSANPRPLRGLVMDSEDRKLMEAYNAAVLALKEFRDTHMVLVALYILGPARKEAKERAEKIANVTAGIAGAEHAQECVQGTGGTDVVKFLKGVRDQTKAALMD